MVLYAPLEYVGLAVTAVTSNESLQMVQNKPRQKRHTEQSKRK